MMRRQVTDGTGNISFKEKSTVSLPDRQISDGWAACGHTHINVYVHGDENIPSPDVERKMK